VLRTAAQRRATPRSAAKRRAVLRSVARCDALPAIYLCKSYANEVNNQHFMQKINSCESAIPYISISGCILYALTTGRGTTGVPLAL